MEKYQDDEFFTIVKDILDNEEFKKTNNIVHHGITRFDHCMRVAYYSYIVSKTLHLDYKETTRAALLHDFFLDEVKEDNSVARLRRHPMHAVNNAKKYFEISEKQEDIIKTHMFPVTFTPPKYIESWIVDLVDDAAAVYEKTYTVKREIQAATTFLFILLINIVRMKI